MTINAIAHGANITFGYISVGITSLAITIISLSTFQFIAIALSACALIALGIYFYQRTNDDDDVPPRNHHITRISAYTPANDTPKPPPTDKEHFDRLRLEDRKEQLEKTVQEQTALGKRFNPDTWSFEYPSPLKKSPSLQPQTSWWRTLWKSCLF